MIFTCYLFSCLNSFLAHFDNKILASLIHSPSLWHTESSRVSSLPCVPFRNVRLVGTLSCVWLSLPCRNAILIRVGYEVNLWWSLGWVWCLRCSWLRISQRNSCTQTSCAFGIDQGSWLLTLLTYRVQSMGRGFIWNVCFMCFEGLVSTAEMGRGWSCGFLACSVPVFVWWGLGLQCSPNLKRYALLHAVSPHKRFILPTS